MLSDGIIPSYSRGVGVVESLHLREQQRALCPEEVIAVSEIVVQQRVFSGRPFPGRQGRRTIRQKNSSQCSVFESQGDAGCILHRKIPDLVTHQGIDFFDLTTDISEVIDLMDQIDKDRASPFSFLQDRGPSK